MDYKDSVAHLFRWCFGIDTSNFHAILFTLIAKADLENRERLRIGFENEVKAYEDWQKTESQDEFFAAHGLTRQASQV